MAFHARGRENWESANGLPATEPGLETGTGAHEHIGVVEHTAQEHSRQEQYTDFLTILLLPTYNSLSEYV